jgi:uncharacterized membrane protein affecting hemolysin expression
MWQDALVTLIALAAAGVLARRYFRARRRRTPSCPSCTVNTAPKRDETPAAKPVTFYR